jgi:Ca2+:H+ antiporter
VQTDVETRTQQRRGPWRRLDLLIVALPAAIAAELFHLGAVAVFAVAALSVIPLAGLIGRATEELAEVVGGSVGALLNATFGTAAEIILGIFLVIDGQIAVLKASLTGSLIGNVLLLLGVSMIVSGYDREHVPVTSGTRGQATLLFVAVSIFVLPTVFSFRAESSTARVDEVSDGIALVLVVLYALGLVFMLRTHRALFRTGGGEEEAAKTGEPAAEAEGDAEGGWSTKGAIAILAVATALVAVAAELVAGSVEEAGASLGLGTGFLGFIVLPLVGNAAEQFSALSLAAKDRLDVAADIAIGASLQLVMLVVPLMVLVGILTGNHVSLTFSVLELAALLISAVLTRQVVDDRQGNWFEGAMLVALYLAFAIAVFFVEV